VCNAPAATMISRSAVIFLLGSDAADANYKPVSGNSAAEGHGGVKHKPTSTPLARRRLPTDVTGVFVGCRFRMPSRCFKLCRIW